MVGDQLKFFLTTDHRPPTAENYGDTNTQNYDFEEQIGGCSGSGKAAARDENCRGAALEIGR